MCSVHCTFIHAAVCAVCTVRVRLMNSCLSASFCRDDTVTSYVTPTTNASVLHEDPRSGGGITVQTYHHTQVMNIFNMAPTF